MTVPWRAGGDYFSIKRAQCSKQCGSSVALVVVSHCASTPLLQRKSWLRAVQSLHLALFVSAQHQRVIWRIKIQNNNVFYLLTEQRIIAELEGSQQVGFK